MAATEPAVTLVDPSGLSISVLTVGCATVPPLLTVEGLTVPIGYRATRTLAGVQFWAELLPVNVPLNEVGAVCSHPVVHGSGP
jgi:hypothetical protein